MTLKLVAIWDITVPVESREEAAGRQHERSPG